MENKEKFIKGIKEALEIEGRDINWEDNFREYEEWDSIGRLSLIAMIDTEFNIQIEEKDFETLFTIQDVFDEVIKRTTTK